MPISTQHECVFVHIPRTGGTTVEKLLGIHRDWPEPDLEVFHGRFDRGNDYYQLQHLSYREMKSVKDIAHTQDYFKFTIVRNPWDRLVSEYFWQNLQDKISFQAFVNRTINIVNNRTRITGAYCHFRPQVEFLGDELNLIIRFENFRSEMRGLMLKFGIRPQSIPKHVATNHKNYSKYYDAETVNMVANAYRMDIDHFSYKFES